MIVGMEQVHESLEPFMQILSFFPSPFSSCVAVIEAPVPLPLNLEEYPHSQQVETSDSSSDSDSELPLSTPGIPDSQAKYVDQSICHPSIHPSLLPSLLPSLPPSFLPENLVYKCTI